MAACRRCGETASARPNFVGVSPPVRRGWSRSGGTIRRRCFCVPFNFVSAHYYLPRLAYPMSRHPCRMFAKHGLRHPCASHPPFFGVSLFLTRFLFAGSRHRVLGQKFSMVFSACIVCASFTPPSPPLLMSRPKVCRICGCVSGESMDIGRH